MSGSRPDVSSWLGDTTDLDGIDTNQGIRVIANTITTSPFTTAKLKTPMRGTGQHLGYGLNDRRVLPKAKKSIIRHVLNGFLSGLKVADYWYDGAWPAPAERVLPFLHAFVGPRAGPTRN
ncbi:MAG: hypothetical protein ABSG53_10770 [Thermoguttaceae bacterium]|jgi:hypothetical protein